MTLPFAETPADSAQPRRSPEAGMRSPEAGMRSPEAGMRLSADAEEDKRVAAAIAGDVVAFRALYTKYRSTVARLVYRMGAPPGDLEDAVQEVFVQVHRSLKDFRGQAKFSTWLHRVTVNVVLMQRRAQKARPAFADEPKDELPADAPLPDEDAERLERLRAFSRLLERLADKKRLVFVLHDLEGVSPAEISTIVGAPVLTVRTRLFYARREIEAMLADEPSLAQLRGSFTRRDQGGDDD